MINSVKNFFTKKEEQKVFRLVLNLTEDDFSTVYKMENGREIQIFSTVDVKPSGQKDGYNIYETNLPTGVYKRITTRPTGTRTTLFRVFDGITELKYQKIQQP